MTERDKGKRSLPFSQPNGRWPTGASSGSRSNMDDGRPLHMDRTRLFPEMYSPYPKNVAPPNDPKFKLPKGPFAPPFTSLHTAPKHLAVNDDFDDNNFDDADVGIGGFSNPRSSQNYPKERANGFPVPRFAEREMFMQSSEESEEEEVEEDEEEEVEENEEEEVEEEDEEEVEEDEDGGAGGQGRGWSQGQRQISGMNDWKLKTAAPGGPMIPELLTGFLGHVAHAIWKGLSRPVLKCHTRLDHLYKWKKVGNRALEFVHGSSLSQLRECMFKSLNMPLISAFVERWHPETNSFHLPFGEMTITLHDVYYILHIPIDGKAISHSYSEKAVQDFLVGGLCIDPGLLDLKFVTLKLDALHRQCCEGYTLLSESVARGYLLNLLGTTLFVDSSSPDRLSAGYYPFIMDLHAVGDYAWGAGALAYLYRELGVASRAECNEIAGCLSLLQAWIYEYFPRFRPSMHVGWSKSDPHACRWNHDAQDQSPAALQRYRSQLDQMRASEITWTPFHTDPSHEHPVTLYRGMIHCLGITEPYMPDRVLRQFGYIQYVPHCPPYQPLNECRPANHKVYMVYHIPSLSKWTNWKAHKLRPDLLSSRAVSPAAITPDYLNWYLARTHPRVSVGAAHPSVAPHMTADERLRKVASYLYYVQPERVDLLTDDQAWEYIDKACAVVRDVLL